MPRLPPSDIALALFSLHLVGALFYLGYNCRCSYESRPYENVSVLLECSVR